MVSSWGHQSHCCVVRFIFIFFGKKTNFCSPPLISFEIFIFNFEFQLRFIEFGLRCACSLLILDFCVEQWLTRPVRNHKISDFDLQTNDFFGFRFLIFSQTKYEIFFSVGLFEFLLRAELPSHLATLNAEPLLSICQQDSQVPDRYSEYDVCT